MTHRIAWLGLVLLATLGASNSECGAPPINTEAINSGNAQVSVDLIATFDGVRLYRVKDGDDKRVYVAVSGRELRAEWWEPQGKTTVHRETLTIPAP